MSETLRIIDALSCNYNISREELTHLLTNITENEQKLLHQKAREISNLTFGNKIYIRGLIELTNY